MANKHELKRYIPAAIRRQIRDEAGYGCVICGSALYQYEHIEPEFCDAKEHDPDKMTLLCPSCHDRVTNTLISKQRVWEAKRSPKTFENGYVHDPLMALTDTGELRIGDCTTSMIGVIFSIYSKPIIWFEPSETLGRCTLCAIFVSPRGENIAFINRNEYVALIGNQDITQEKASIKIKDDKHGVLLELDRTGDKPLHIQRLYTYYLNTELKVPGIYGGFSITSANAPRVDVSKLRVEISNVNHNDMLCLYRYGCAPHSNGLNMLEMALFVARYGIPVLNFFGGISAWIADSKIISKTYKVVGVIKGRQAFDLTGTYVADYINDQFLCKDDQYETGEPIFVYQNDRLTRNVKKVQGFDLSYRFK